MSVLYLIRDIIKAYSQRRVIPRWAHCYIHVIVHFAQRVLLPPLTNITMFLLRTV